VTKLLDELLAQIQAVDEEIRGRAGIAWYRGHGMADWPLLSTLHRHMRRLTATSGEPDNMREILRGEYRTLYRQFKGEAWPLLDERERSEWGVIFAMQHYGIPTRFMDWTESFGCALFFAQHQRQRGDVAAIWILDPEGLNSLTIGQNGIITFDDLVSESDIDGRAWHPRYQQPAEDLPTIAVAPLFANARMTAQRSRFTLSGDSFLSLNEQLNGELVKKRALVKVKIPAELFDELNDYLRVTGLRPFTFYPDFYGLKLEHEARVQKTLRDIGVFTSKGAVST
jgi:hypothetical protein